MRFIHWALVALAILVLPAAAHVGAVEVVDTGTLKPEIEVHYTGATVKSRTITNIIAYEDYVILQFAPPAPVDVTGCAKGNQVYLDMHAEIGNPIYAAAMTAATSGRTVNLKFLQGVCDDTWDAAQLYQINVRF